MASTSGYWVAAILALASAASGQFDVIDERQWGPNRVLNESFEVENEGWNRLTGARQAGAVVESIARLETTAARTGSQSAYLSGDGRTTLWYSVESDPINVDPGKDYRASGWIKTRNVMIDEGQYHNCNLYVRFRDAAGEVVPVAFSPVKATRKFSGTNDWQQVNLTVTAPERSVTASVGCALTCTGGAWFDDIGFQERKYIPFKTTRSDEIIYLHRAGDAPSEDVQRRHIETIRRIEEHLGVRCRQPVRFYKYADARERDYIIGSGVELRRGRNEIHAADWNEMGGFCRVLLGQNLGSSLFLFEEGISGYCDAWLTGGDPHAEARRIIRTGSITSPRAIISKVASQVVDPATLAAATASFVSFLIERYGVERFKQVFPYKPKPPNETMWEVPERCDKVYGKILGKLEREWRDFLLDKKPSSAADDAPHPRP